MAGVHVESAASTGRKPRVLCLHGFRTSGEIMRRQVMGKWPDSLTGRLDLVFLDAPFPAEGSSAVEGIFPPPYYEWYQFDKVNLVYGNVDKCLEYVEEYMIKHGPFDGLMGFSRGGTLSAALTGMQAKGLALTRVPNVKFVIIIEGGMLLTPFQEKAYAVKINCPSLHFIGEMDYLKPQSEALLQSFIHPLVISHPKGHTVPRLDEKGLEMALKFIETIETNLQNDSQSNTAEDGLVTTVTS